MAKAYFQLSVTTEGLSEEWITFPGVEGRIERPPMSPEQIAVLSNRINEENGQGASCSFFLRGKNRQLQLELIRGRFVASNPDDVQYQNLILDPKEVESFLTDYFNGLGRRVESKEHGPEAGEEALGPDGVPEPEEETALPSRNWRIMEASLAVAVLVAFAATVLVIKRYPDKVAGLMGIVEVEELADPQEAKELVNRWAGVYATHVRDGGMIIELRDSGQWAYYEIWKYSSGNYVMDQLHAGEYRPVQEHDRTALLTDSSFLFYPDDRQQLTFLDRPFKKIGNRMEELSYLVFPTMEANLAGNP